MLFALALVARSWEGISYLKHVTVIEIRHRAKENDFGWRSTFLNSTGPKTKEESSSKINPMLGAAFF